MDLLQKQIMVLTAKIDALHQMVEQLNLKVVQVLAEGSLSQINPQNGTLPMGYGVGHSYRKTDLTLEHKDILQDHTHTDLAGKNGDKPLSPEVQIQRLTAQLTASYNQIAALEERLLAQRVH